MAIAIDDKFVCLPVEQTRCPDKVRALAPSAREIYVLRERLDCRYWDHVRDCFHQVEGAYIVTRPVAGRRYFTLDPRRVIARLEAAGVW